MRKIAVVVAGMHRSGTSAATRVLASLGCDLPRTLMEPNEYNTAGYWESEAVAEFNDALLESAGSTWDDWEPFNPDWYASPVADGYRSRALALLAAEFSDSPLFVLKDPRVCRLLPFWADALAAFEADARIAVPIRNPLEVAASLQHRDAMDPSVGLLLWLRHVLDAEAASRDLPRAFVRYEELLNNWQPLADALARNLAVSWPRRSTSLDLEIEDRLDRSARHHAHDDTALPDSPEVSPWVESTFLIVDRWTRGEERDGDRAELDATRSAFDEAGSTFARAVVRGTRAAQRNRTLEKEVTALNEVVADREGQIGSLNRAVADREENVGYLDGLVREKDRELDRLGDVLTERDRQIDALHHVVAGRDGEIGALNDALADRNRHVEGLGEAVSDRDDRIAAFEEELAARARDLESLTDTINARGRETAALQDDLTRRRQEIEGLKGAVRDLETLTGTINAREREIEALQDDLTRRCQEIAELKDAVRDGEARTEDRDRQIEALHQVVEHRDVELAGVYGSASWRITKPARVVKQGLRVGGAGAIRGLRFVLGGSLRLFWRLLPLPATVRAGLKRRALGAVPALRPLGREMPPAGADRGYVPSGWLDLADLNYESRRNGSALPILFDPDWYLATYPDVRAAELEPLAHYLEHGATEGRWPVDIDPGTIDATIQALHRCDLASEEADAFDPSLCRVLYPDLAALSDGELALVCQGGGERIGSPRALLAELCENPREIPIDFDAVEYIRLYPDLRWLGEQSPLEALRHYMRHGRFEPRLHTLRTDPIDDSVQDGADVEASERSTDIARPLCVLAHVYYPELWEELAGYLRNLPADVCDLYVNLVDDTFEAALLSRIRDAFPLAHVYVSENGGRDVGGHFRLLRNLRIDDYPVFCLVHTKKSPHMSPGEAQRWRRKLLGPLMGSREIAADNVRAMLEDDGIGQLGAAACCYTEMNANRERYDRLLERLGIAEAPEELEFVSGTMMFLRSDVLARVFEAAANVTLDDSREPNEETSGDGAWEHAVERVFGAVVHDMHYRLEWR